MCASALALAVMAPVRHAQAACVPAAPVSNVSVSCTGVTVDQNGTNGYGAGAENNLNISVATGASVSGDTNGFDLGSGNTLNNSGTITGGTGAGIIGDVTVINNASGVISGGTGIQTTANVTNYGTISGTANGIVPGTGANVTNYGMISGGNFGIVGPGDFNVTNSGTIVGGNVGIFAVNTNATVSNSGMISGNASGVEAAQIATVTNSGTIAGSINGVFAKVANVVNSGTISGRNSGGGGIRALVVNVSNSGTISSSFGFGIDATSTANVTNSGTISGRTFGIGANIANVTNSGAITGGTVGIGANTANVTNSGAITGGTFGINANTVNVTNSGTITGGTGIIGQGTASTLVNSGTIIGTGGTAIDFSASNTDTLTFLPGTRIFGAMLLGAGDTVNIVAGRDIAWLLTFTPNGPFTINGSGNAPFAISGNQVATLDPTAFGMADRTLVQFSGAVSSLIQSRFDDLGWPGAPSGGGYAFAPPAVNGIMEAANSAFAGIPALAYASDHGIGTLPNASVYDPISRIAVWSQGFIGSLYQPATDTMLASTNTIAGGAVGVDGPFGPNLRLGAFIGAGDGRLSVEPNSQWIGTDYVFGGGYGRFDWDTRFLRFAVSTGYTTNNSTRTIADNLSPTGFDTATASYGGWYVSPELAYGVRLPLDAMTTLTPIGRVRYLGASLNGYTEAGSAQALTVARRNLSDVEERFELDLTSVDRVGVVRTTVKAGVLGLERLGDTNVNAALIGQSIAFVAPGQNATAGAFAGFDIDFRVTHSVSLFAAGEGLLMSDRSQIGTLKAGLRVVN